jgi:hypothetical protein
MDGIQAVQQRVQLWALVNTETDLGISLKTRRPTITFSKRLCSMELFMGKLCRYSPVDKEQNHEI